MGADTKIQWATHTFNPWRGCTKVSPGCANCYAEKLVVNRLKGAWGKGVPRTLASESYWKQPARWNAEAERTGIRPRVFCASLADWLDDEVPVEWLERLLKLIAQTPHLDWLLLTKRPENWLPRLQEVARVATDDTVFKFVEGWMGEDVPANVWVGTTTEDQQRYDERVGHLCEIPAFVRFLSVEPMLGPIDMQLGANLPGQRMLRWHKPARLYIDWVIVGGESGPGARPFNVEWARNIVAQCRAAGVAPFVKQMGAATFEQSPGAHGPSVPLFAIKDKKGGNIDEWPEELRVRELPTRRAE